MAGCFAGVRASIVVMVLLWLVGRWGKDQDCRVRACRGEKRLRFSNILRKLCASDSTGSMDMLQGRLRQCEVDFKCCEDLSGKVLALLDVHPLVVPDGVLAVLSREQRLSWMLHARADMAFNSVKHVFSLQQPAEALIVGNKPFANRPLFQLQKNFVESLGVAAATCGDGQSTVRQALQLHGLLSPQEAMPVVALQLWCPLAYLINRNLWHDLSLPQDCPAAVMSGEAAASVQCLIHAAQQPAPSMSWGRLPLEASSSQFSLHPRQFREWADTVRGWATSLNHSDQDWVADSLRVSMELMVSSLEQHADSLELISSGMFECTQWGFRRYDLVFLIRCLICCTNLRSDEVLRRNLIASLHVLFHGGVGGQANYFVEMLADEKFPLPSPATLGHMRFVLDCVHMLHMREYHATCFLTADQRRDEMPANPAMFFLLDSSPQGNVNWLMIEYFFVAATSLKSVCAKAWRLHKLGRVKWEDDPDEDRVAEECALIESLRQELQHHVLPPVGLGSGRSDLQHELHAFLHSLFLETGDFKLLRSVAQQTTALVTDKGTEAGVQTAPRVRLRDFLPFAQGDPFMVDGDGDNLSEADLTIDFASSLGVHGLQHFVNNCTKGIADAMPYFWEEIYPGMNALVNCLNASYFRQRFAATCLTSPSGKAWCPKFEEGFQCTLIGWRFGSLAECNKKLLEYQYPLKTFWDDDKIKFRNEQPADQDFGQHLNPPQAEAPPPRPHSQKPDGPNLSLASQACRSDMFWGWQRMFSKIANIVAHMMNWLQSCPCHSFSHAEWGARGHELAKRLFMQSKPSVHCPLMGFRAAEIACGQFSQWIDTVAGFELAEISMTLEGCTATERAHVLADCQASRQHIVFAVQAELGCWQRTPRVFCGISHPDEALARLAVLSGFQEWQAMSDAEKSQAHAVTRRFCAEGPLNAEIMDFLSGVARERLPLVMQECGRFLFVPVNEISVERLHAQTHQKLKHAPNAGPAAISWAHRSPAFLQKVSASPELLKEVANQCAQVYHPLKLVPRLGLATHPDIVDVIAASTIETCVGQFEYMGSTRAFDKIAKRIIYHLDIASQFLPSLRVFANKPGGSGPQAAQDSTLQDLQRQLMLDKFRADHVPGTFYTIKKSDVPDNFLVAGVLPEFRVYAKPLAAAAGTLFQADGEAQAEAGQVAGGGQAVGAHAQPVGHASEYIAFQVLNIKPAAKKYALCDTSKQLRAADVAVCQHAILRLDPGSRELEVAAEPMVGAAAWSRCLNEKALESCYAWQSRPGSLSVVFSSGLSGDVEDVDEQWLNSCVLSLYLEQAVPGSSNYLPAEDLEANLADALAILCDKGYVQQHEGLCQLTARGVAALKVTQVLVEPQILQSKEENMEPSKRSGAALLRLLVSQGWELKRVSKAEVVPLLSFSAEEYRPPKTLVLGQNRKTIDREYLLCLVLLQDVSHRQKLLDIGITSVAHLLPTGYYAALNKVDELKLQAVLMQADAGDDGGDWANAAHLVRAAWRRTGAGRTFKLDTSFRWGCVSFKGTRKKLKDGGYRLGYQCDCPRHSHSKVLPSGGRTLCTWTMTYTDEESRLHAVRVLKWWVSQAWVCDSKASHQALRKRVPDELPSMSHLDANTPAEDRPVTEDEGGDEPAEVSAKRARVSGRGAASSSSRTPKAKAAPKASDEGGQKGRAARARGRGRGRGRRGRGRGAPVGAEEVLSANDDEAASDPPSEGSEDSCACASGSSDSSSSSSTSSSD